MMLSHVIHIHYNYNDGRLDSIREWCRQNAPNAYTIQWVDGWTYGKYELAFEYEADLLAFKLRFENDYYSSW